MKKLTFRFQDLKLLADFEDKYGSRFGVLFSNGIISSFQLKSEAKEFLNACSDLSEDINIDRMIENIHYNVKNTFKCVVKDFSV